MSNHPNPNVHAEHIVNSKGVSTVVYKRNQKAPSKGISKVPAPMLAAQTTKPKKAPTGKQIVKALDDRLVELGGQSRPEKFGYEANQMDNYPDALKQRMVDYISTADIDDISMLSQMFTYEAERPGLFEIVTEHSDFVKKVIEHRTNGVGSNPYRELQNTFSNMELREAKTPLDKDTLAYVKAEYLADQIGMHASGFKPVHKYYGELEKIKDNMDRIEDSLPMVLSVRLPYGKETAQGVMELVALGERYPNNIEAVSGLVQRSGATNIEDIEAMIGEGSNALTDGIL